MLLYRHEDAVELFTNSCHGPLVAPGGPLTLILHDTRFHAGCRIPQSWCPQHQPLGIRAELFVSGRRRVVGKSHLSQLLEVPAWKLRFRCTE